MHAFEVWSIPKVTGLSFSAKHGQAKLWTCEEILRNLEGFYKEVKYLYISNCEHQDRKLFCFCSCLPWFES